MDVGFQSKGYRANDRGIGPAIAVFVAALHESEVVRTRSAVTRREWLLR